MIRRPHRTCWAAAAVGRDHPERWRKLNSEIRSETHKAWAALATLNL